MFVEQMIRFEIIRHPDLTEFFAKPRAYLSDRFQVSDHGIHRLKQTLWIGLSQMRICS